MLKHSRARDGGDGRGGGGPATAPGPHPRFVERGEERATRAGALPRPIRRPRRRVHRRSYPRLVGSSGNRRAKAGVVVVVVVVVAGAPVGPGARALGPGRRQRAARTPAAPGDRSRDPAPPGRAAVRGAPRRVVVGAHPPSRLDAQAPAGGGGSSSRSCRGCGPGRRASYSTGTSGPTPSGPPRGITPRRAARAGAGGTRCRLGSSGTA